MMPAAFSPASLQFLAENARNNSREWFRSNRAVYEASLLKPFQQLVKELTPPMQYMDGGLEGTISRIHRDTRFSHDKSLYRDRMWLAFMRRGGNKTEFPGFFLEINPSFYRYGMGFFRASPQTMAQYRLKIDQDEAAFLDLVSALSETGALPEGEIYKRNRYTGGVKEIAGWYNRKNIYLTHNRADVGELFEFDPLLQRLLGAFDELEGFYRFFRDAVMR
ncbi:DUF2461 domain-containing protein [Oxalobacter sp. OttesenSCG-928-P03]|nr:DUF2461 domain-containing protein [Oxalobacter sp. OttesenSCG-928-P03]